MHSNTKCTWDDACLTLQVKSAGNTSHWELFVRNNPLRQGNNPSWNYPSQTIPSRPFPARSFTHSLLFLLARFAEYSLFYRALLQKRPIILRSLLIVATLASVAPWSICGVAHPGLVWSATCCCVTCLMLLWGMPYMLLWRCLVFAHVPRRCLVFAAVVHFTCSFSLFPIAGVVQCTGSFSRIQLCSTPTWCPHLPCALARKTCMTPPPACARCVCHLRAPSV